MVLHPFRRQTRSASMFCRDMLPNGGGTLLPNGHAVQCNGHGNDSNGNGNVPLMRGLSPFMPTSAGRAGRTGSLFASLVAIPLGGGGDTRAMKRGLRDSVYAVSTALGPLLCLMRVLGLFPCHIRSTPRQNKRFWRFSKRLFFLLISLAALGLNIYLFKFNVSLLLLFCNRFGLMHASSVSAMVTGIKPLINAVYLVIFSVRVRAHLRMLRLMDSVDRSYWSAFHRSPRIRSRMLPIFYVFLTIIFAIPLAYRIFESLQPSFLLTKNRDARNATNKSPLDWLLDPSFPIVPLLTLWNVLPLGYYVLCNRLACYWCRTLTLALQKEHQKRRYSLKFYYQQFLKLTDLQESIGDVFNPFVFFSLAWSLLILSLTIYFLTQPTLYEHLQMQTPRISPMLSERIWLNLGWSLLQIIIALSYICVICAVGTATNEQSRNILAAVLSVIPDSNAELDRFQINCFVHKMSTQYLWGMTVWRAFPLERSTFFTLVSVIITYSFLLLKLKDNTIPDSVLHSTASANAAKTTAAGGTTMTTTAGSRTTLASILAVPNS